MALPFVAFQIAATGRRKAFDRQLPDVLAEGQPEVPERLKHSLDEPFFGRPDRAIEHDEDIEIYINGVFAAKEAGFVTSYQPLPITPAARALLKPGATITIAAHCREMRRSFNCK